MLIDEQQLQLQKDLTHFKEAFWPFELLNRFKNNLESFASNKMVALGLELAHLAINLFISKRKEGASNADVVKSFLANVVEHFMDSTKNKGQQQDQDDANKA